MIRSVDASKVVLDAPPSAWRHAAAQPRAANAVTSGTMARRAFTGARMVSNGLSPMFERHELPDGISRALRERFDRLSPRDQARVLARLDAGNRGRKGGF